LLFFRYSTPSFFNEFDLKKTPTYVCAYWL
jgi:hypothetical protein